MTLEDKGRISGLSGGRIREKEGEGRERGSSIIRRPSRAHVQCSPLPECGQVSDLLLIGSDGLSLI